MMLLDAARYHSAMQDLFRDAPPPPGNPPWRVRPLIFERYKIAARSPREPYDSARADAALRWVKEHLFVQNAQTGEYEPLDYLFLGRRNDAYQGICVSRGIQHLRPLTDEASMRSVWQLDDSVVQSHIQHAVDAGQMNELLRCNERQALRQAHKALVASTASRLGVEGEYEEQGLWLAESLMHRMAVERMLGCLGQGFAERIGRHTHVDAELVVEAALDYVGRRLASPPQDIRFTSPGLSNNPRTAGELKFCFEAILQQEPERIDERMAESRHSRRHRQDKWVSGLLAGSVALSMLSPRMSGPDAGKARESTPQAVTQPMAGGTSLSSSFKSDSSLQKAWSERATTLKPARDCLGP